MECQDARLVIQAYLDGELTEEKAAPLRKHLLDCQACRAGAQTEKNTRRWFVQPKAVPVPRDFAARVARRAFAGDRGERFSEPEPALAGARGGAAVLSLPARRSEERNLRFVMTMTAVAATLLLMISMAIRSLNLPTGSRLSADDSRTMSIQEARQQLDLLNQKDNPAPALEKNSTDPLAKPAATAPDPAPAERKQ